MPNEIENHIEEHIGKISFVYHEIVSDEIHLDVYVVGPSEKRNIYTLVTYGMSERPMAAPTGKDGYRFAELVLSLPATWPLTQEDMQSEEIYWPVKWLKIIARLPHDQNTWVSFGHTVPNGAPPKPFSSNTKQCCWIMSFPLLFGRQFGSWKVDELKTINFFSLISIYKEELDFKLKKGAKPLIERLLRNKVNEVINVNRENVCKKRFGIF